MPNFARSGVLLLATLIALAGAPAAQADEAQDRAAALVGTIDWVRQTGEDKIVPPDACGQFLILCGPDGASFKLKSANSPGGIARSFMWIGGRTALLTQTKKRAIYLVLDPEGEVIRIAVVSLADGKERTMRNDDPKFTKLLELEIKFWQSKAPINQ